MINRLKQYISLYQKFSDEQAVFVYQMGKVGSTSLEHSLNNAIHIHNFYSRNHPCQLRLLGLAGFGWRYFVKRLNQEIEYLLMRTAFNRRKHTKIITLVRKPLARNISMYFHDLDAYLFDAYTNCQRTNLPPMATREQNSALLSQVFIERFDHNYVLDWFDNEFKVMTGIDIYQHNYKRSANIIKNKKYSIFLCDISELNNEVDQLSKFIDAPFELASVNQGDNKWYAQQYDQFKTSFQVPKNIKQKIESSKYYQHFYGEQ